jgi:hypothetical protein
MVGSSRERKKEVEGFFGQLPIVHHRGYVVTGGVDLKAEETPAIIIENSCNYNEFPKTRRRSLLTSYAFN